MDMNCCLAVNKCRINFGNREGFCESLKEDLQKRLHCPERNSKLVVLKTKQTLFLI